MKHIKAHQAVTKGQNYVLEGNEKVKEYANKESVDGGSKSRYHLTIPKRRVHVD